MLLVAGAGLATWRVRRDGGPLNSATSQPAGTPARLTAGHDYYLHVKLIELADKPTDAKQWDSVGDSGPDICFSLTWRNNVIWKSQEKPDTLIGSWDLMKVDVKQIIMSGGQTDLEGLVNAPLIHYDPGGAVEMKVWDEDTVGSDDAGSIVIKLDEMNPGENVLAPPMVGENAVRRVVLSLIDRRTPLPELVYTISNR